MLKDREKILVIDDTQSIRNKLVSILNKENYITEEACNGIEALHKATLFAPDLILLDVIMPDMDGLKVLKSFRDNPFTQDIPIIMVTAQDEGKDIKTGFDLGANDYVTKPFDDDVLLAHIRRHLEIKKRFDQIRDEKDDLFVTNQLITTLHAKKKTRDILYCLVQKISEYIQVKRCSVIRIEQDGSLGFVEATSDGPEIRDLKIDLVKYPEIMEALKQKDVVIIPNVNEDERMQKVRDVLHEVGCFSLIVVPVIHGDDLIGTLLLNTAREKETFNEREIRFLKGIAQAAKTALLNAHIFESIEEKGQKSVGSLDPLTQLNSYYQLLMDTEKEIYRAERYNNHLSLILIDIIALRKVNKHHGHDKGDLILKEVARLIEGSTRKSDVAARCQGGKFAILLPETSHLGATVKAKSFQNSLRKSQTLHKYGVSVMVGVSSIEESEIKSPIDLIHAAEIELERTKTGPFAL